MVDDFFVEEKFGSGIPLRVLEQAVEFFQVEIESLVEDGESLLSNFSVVLVESVVEAEKEGADESCREKNSVEELIVREVRKYPEADEREREVEHHAGADVELHDGLILVGPVFENIDKVDDSGDLR